MKVDEPIDPQDPTTIDDQKGLQASDIAAIVLGVILGLTIIGDLIYFLIIRKKKSINYKGRNNLPSFFTNKKLYF